MGLARVPRGRCGPSPTTRSTPPPWPSRARGHRRRGAARSSTPCSAGRRLGGALRPVWRGTPRSPASRTTRSASSRPCCCAGSSALHQATADPAVSAEPGAGRATRLDRLGPRPPSADEPLALHLVLQDAYDRTAQRRLVRPAVRRSRPCLETGTLVRPAPGRVLHRRPIRGVPPPPRGRRRRHRDARLRRVLRLALGYLPLAHEPPVAQCPVLLSPGPHRHRGAPRRRPSTADAVRRPPPRPPRPPGVEVVQDGRDLLLQLRRARRAGLPPEAVHRRPRPHPARPGPPRPRA